MQLPEDVLRNAIERWKSVLSWSVEPDVYLSGIASRAESHRFLGNSTQAVYQRQVRLLSKILQAYMRRQPGEISVLDWGCGKAHITYLMQREGFVVTACDRHNDSDDSAFGQSAPIIAELNIPVVPLQDDVELPFESGSFDCVTSFGVLEHVPRDLDSLKEIRRVLRPGGVFYVTFLPYPLSWTQALARARGDGYHDRLYSRRRLRELAAAAGFTVHWLQLAQLLPKNSVPLWLDPLLEKVDRGLCRFTPLGYFATNLEAVLTAP